MRWLAALALILFPWSAQCETIAGDGVSVEFPAGTRQLAENSHRTLIEARKQLTAQLPATPPQIRVILCDTPEAFRALAGPLSTFSIVGVALPDQDLIVLKSPALTPPGSDYVGTLRHELVHVLLPHNVKAERLPRWLNEGLAMVWSGESRWQSRSVVADMYLDGRILRYDALEASFLDPGQEQKFGDAYAQAYSMTQYLQSRMGNAQFTALLRRLDNQSFADALDAELGIVPYDFWEQWRNSLQSTAFVVWIVSGVVLFQIMALLTLLAFLRKWRRGKRVIATWEKEDQQDQPDIPPAE